jgi:hypothetical protein
MTRIQKQAEAARRIGFIGDCIGILCEQIATAVRSFLYCP